MTLDDQVLGEKSFISRKSFNPVLKICFPLTKIFTNHFRLAKTKKNYSGRLQTLRRSEILMQCQNLHLKAVESYRVKLFSWSSNSQRSNWVELSRLLFCRKILWNTQVFNYLHATVHITTLARHVREQDGVWCHECINNNIERWKQAHRRDRSSVYTSNLMFTA